MKKGVITAIAVGSLLLGGGAGAAATYGVMAAHQGTPVAAVISDTGASSSGASDLEDALQTCSEDMSTISDSADAMKSAGSDMDDNVTEFGQGIYAGDVTQLGYDIDSSFDQLSSSYDDVDTAVQDCSDAASAAG